MVSFETKNPTLVLFWRAFKMDNIGLFFRPFGILYGHLIYCMAVWCSLWSFGICIFPVLYVLIKKNLATLALACANGTLL
jgi:hypothetical protein